MFVRRHSLAKLICWSEGGESRPSLIVSQSQSVPVPLCPSPIVYQTSVVVILFAYIVGIYESNVSHL